MLKPGMTQHQKPVKTRSQLFTLLAINLGLGLLINGVGTTPATANPVVPLQAQGAPANSLLPPLTLAQLQNATYQIPLLGNVTLTNGVYQSQTQPAVEVKMSKKFVIGDVNQDGGLDAVTVLRVTEAGRKPTYYLAAVTNQNGQPRNLDTISIGQGFGVKSVSMKGSQVSVAVVKYGPRDAPCCPSDVLSQSYWFNAGAGEFIASSFDARTPSPGSIPVRVTADPLNAEINNNIPGSPPATAIEF